MCDFEGKLTAWLDQELSAEDAAAVELHLRACTECRGRVEAFRRLSGAFDRYCDAYYDAAAAPRSGRRRFRRVLATSCGVAMAAGMAMVFLLAPRARVRQSPAIAGVPASNTIDVVKAESPVQAGHPADAAKPISRIQHHNNAGQGKQASGRRQREETSWVASEPAVEIAIPAEEILPPGAAPDGVGFTAYVTIAPDGSAQQIRLQPQLTEFERRATRP